MVIFIPVFMRRQIRFLSFLLCGQQENEAQIGGYDSVLMDQAIASLFAINKPPSTPYRVKDDP